METKQEETKKETNSDERIARLEKMVEELVASKASSKELPLSNLPSELPMPLPAQEPPKPQMDMNAIMPLLSMLGGGGQGMSQSSNPFEEIGKKAVNAFMRKVIGKKLHEHGV